MDLLEVESVRNAITGKSEVHEARHFFSREAEDTMWGERPESERGLPVWQLEALDRQRAEESKNRSQNPAIWNKLLELEAKLDRILDAVTNGNSTDG